MKKNRRNILISFFTICLLFGCSSTNILSNINITPLKKDIITSSLIKKDIKKDINENQTIIEKNDPESFTDINKVGWIKPDKTSLYEKNNINSSIIKELNKKDYVILKQESKNWYYLSINDVEGYILKDNITFTNPNPIPKKSEEISSNKNNKVSNTIQITNRDASDLYPDDGEIIATINIPSVGLYTSVVYGDSQSNIDTYDVVLRNYHHFGASMTSILAGHNYKSFSKLTGVHVGDIINIHSYYGDFKYKVILAQVGHTDGSNIYDANNNPLIDYYSFEKRIALYTCHSSSVNNRFLLIAEQI